MRTSLLVLSTLATACGSQREPLVSRPQSYSDRMAAADEHSERAEQHRQAAKRPDTHTVSLAGYQCGDTVLADQVTSGGERLTPVVPCWDVAEEHAAHQRLLAEREQGAADQERRAAARLFGTELAACRGLSERELEHSPFSHRRSISAVIPHRVTGTVRGVRVVFKPVPALTVEWMRQAIACHRARFERLGEPATYMPDDPTLVAGANVSVEQHRGHLEVVIESPDAGNARVSLDRAQDLVRPRTASR